VWPRQKDARGETTKINYGVDTGEKKKKRGRPRKTWMEGVRAAMKTRHLEAVQWLNRKEWCLGSGRRRQLSQDRKDGLLLLLLLLLSSFSSGDDSTNKRTVKYGTVRSPVMFIAQMRQHILK
jgi:hypothetical protein